MPSSKATRRLSRTWRRAAWDFTSYLKERDAIYASAPVARLALLAATVAKRILPRIPVRQIAGRRIPINRRVLGGWFNHPAAWDMHFAHVPATTLTRTASFDVVRFFETQRVMGQ